MDKLTRLEWENRRLMQLLLKAQAALADAGMPAVAAFLRSQLDGLKEDEVEAPEVVWAYVWAAGEREWEVALTHEPPEETLMVEGMKAVRYVRDRR